MTTLSRSTLFLFLTMTLSLSLTLTISVQGPTGSARPGAAGGARGGAGQLGQVGRSRWQEAGGRRHEAEGAGGLGVAEFLKGATVRSYGRAKFVRDCARIVF